MKKSNSLIESQGLVDKDGIQWYDLSDLITEYIYDLQHGLNSDPFYDGESAVINENQIKSYYQYLHSKEMPSYIIPDWIGGFLIVLRKAKRTNGTFLAKEAKLVNNVLVFTIEANDSMDSPDLLRNTLVHEFQHAYSFWLQLTKGVSFHNAKTSNMYRHATKGFDNERYGGQYHPMVMQKFVDYLEINDEIFENPLYLERTILTGFYYSNTDEIRSFTQEFATDIMHQIKNNIDTIRDEIKTSLKFKGDFNNVTKEEQFRSNILNNLSITCYSSRYYKVYKSYYKFYKKLETMNVDEDIAYDAIKGSSKAIRICLGIPPNKKIVEFDGDGNKVLKEIAKKQIPIFENALRKMQKIFVKLISEIPVK